MHKVKKSDVLMVFSWILAALLITSLSTNLREKKMEQLQQQVELQPMYDYGHDVLPDLSSYRNWVHGLVVIIFIIFLIKSPGRLIADMLLLYATLLVLRSLTICMTHVPPPRKRCKPYKILGYYLGGCSDMMFSGHTAFVALSCLYLVWYGLVKDRCLKGVVILYTVFTIVFIISTRHHYSMDVIVSLYISFFAFFAIKRDAQGPLMPWWKEMRMKP